MQNPFEAIKELDAEGRDAGSVSLKDAEAKALAEYEKFWRIQDKTIRSDFDKLIEGIE